MKIVGGKYHLNNLIGEGTYGKVYYHHPYALKELKLPKNQKSSLTRLFENEIQILLSLNHPNIVRLYEVIQEQSTLYLVMEHCKTDLKNIMFGKIVGEKVGLQYMTNILEGCKELVDLNIVHRDFKPGNILVEDGVCKIADFGMAKVLALKGKDMLDTYAGTPYYMSPQILQGNSYSRKCDIWSLGVILYEMVFGRLPWDGKDQFALLNDILRKPLHFPRLVSISTKQILERMLTVSEYNRIDWQQLFILFDLEQKKEINGESSQVFHRNLVDKMLTIEAKRLAFKQYGKQLEDLEKDKRTKVLLLLGKYFRQDLDLLGKTNFFNKI